MLRDVGSQGTAHEVSKGNKYSGTGVGIIHDIWVKNLVSFCPNPENLSSLI